MASAALSCWDGCWLHSNSWHLPFLSHTEADAFLLLQVFTCSVCQEVFKRRMELRLHVVSHTGEMPYKVSSARSCAAWCWAQHGGRAFLFWGAWPCLAGAAEGWLCHHLVAGTLWCLQCIMSDCKHGFSPQYLPFSLSLILPSLVPFPGSCQVPRAAAEAFPTSELEQALETHLSQTVLCGSAAWAPTALLEVFVSE